ncbi:hypothetical protein NCCP2222_34100 [Sporosarcina sp. NCCP-2222]|uniref:DUF1646 family protein n=1 Tax=Sporosarcina sp. NCCP-2222 TaxID=2935073 RepID=UPI0020892110|nr:DUF1646 family protein [Sporosarcina sp. NCCP-2222]GKV57463.1 hypothetical protein NCCP2222_34100 [Sporosarcina sp. NCCP-2222]
MYFLLLIILLSVLLLPFLIPAIERNLELFLFVMGLSAAICSGVLDKGLLLKAIEDPAMITIAVVAAGFLFKWIRHPFETGITKLMQFLPQRLFFPIIIIVLGLLSSIITAIIAAIILASITTVLNLHRKSEIRFVILACFSIGLGAVLTPIGEPLSTIATSKLNADFSYLFNLIGSDILLGVTIFGILGAVCIEPVKNLSPTRRSQSEESAAGILWRGVKVYVFVMALTMLGAGFEPVIERFLIGVNPLILYWINMISAILDNATLAAAEISIQMDAHTIRSVLLGLLVSGGMLIPGNIPNIIVAGKLNITSAEWARFGLPLGLLAMLFYFIVIVTTR